MPHTLSAGEFLRELEGVTLAIFDEQRGALFCWRGGRRVDAYAADSEGRIEEGEWFVLNDWQGGELLPDPTREEARAHLAAYLALD